MKKLTRDSGIEDIGNIHWGTHIGQMYCSKDDFFNVAAPYIKSGLLNNEMCLWIYAQNTDEEEIACYLGKHMQGVDRYIKRGQLKLVSYNEWYLEGDSFNEVRTCEKWINYINKSKEQGYDGLRATADTAWLEKSYFRSFEQYESKINKLIPELPFIVLCLYDENKADKLQFAEIINNHSYIIINNEGKQETIKNVELSIKDKQLNEAIEYSNIKTEFFTNISHELRTPLNVILGSLQMMKINNPERNEKDEKYLNIIKQNCYRLVRMIGNLIDLTKIDADYYNIKKENLEIVHLVEEITRSVEEYALSKNINVLFSTEVDERVIACDPDQVERIILNLLSNAIKFSGDKGEILVHMREDEEKIIISVKDDGIGIPYDKQSVIFERFSQVDKSFTRKHEGSGIGLSLAKALVEKHEGKIHFKSEPNKGSEFIVELPCVIADGEPSSNIFKNTKELELVERAQIEFSDIYS